MNSDFKVDNQEEKHIYIAIDLKSFYASVECAQRELDALTTNLVVADESRTQKTICLAVSPALKKYGIPGRARLFEVVQAVNKVNSARRAHAQNHVFSGKSVDAKELEDDPSLELDFVIARPQMALYMQKSAEIYRIYLEFFSKEDIHVYSIDEVFIDITHYLSIYDDTPRNITRKVIGRILEKTGITATAGIAPNLYLCKAAMDIVAKHIPADKDGVRIAELDEITYRKQLWSHRPLTDFWRVGHGYAKKLEQNGLFTMGDIARCSIGSPNEYYNEDLLYKLFGVNAELLIDHAWGWEPCTIADIKAYKPENNSIGSGQVIHCAYDYEQTKLVVKEMTEQLVLDLVAKNLVTERINLVVCYDIDNLTDPVRSRKYKGPIVTDRYGRSTPKNAHGTVSFEHKTSSSRLIIAKTMELYAEIVNKDLLCRRIYITAENVSEEKNEAEEPVYEQLDLFTDYSKRDQNLAKEKKELEKEKNIQEAVLEIKKKYGNNAILKGMNLLKDATTIDRNNQIGGHRA